MASRLIAYESSQNKLPDARIPFGFHVYEMLRPQLATLMGNGGFRALVSRALSLANEEVPWLHDVQVKPDGSLEGLGKLEDELSTEQIAEGRVVLLAQLFGLLVAFIGESLTLQLVHEIWPKAPLHDGESGYGVKK